MYNKAGEWRVGPVAPGFSWSGRARPQGLTKNQDGEGAFPLIQVIAGNKGSGKTKRLIDMTNKASQESHHDIVFIDDDNRYMFDLRHEVRFVNAGNTSWKTTRCSWAFYVAR